MAKAKRAKTFSFRGGDGVQVSGEGDSFQVLRTTMGIGVSWDTMKPEDAEKMAVDILKRLGWDIDIPKR